MYIFSINIFWIQILPSYYWLMYALGFIAWYYIIKKRGKFSINYFSDKQKKVLETKNLLSKNKKQVPLLDNLLFYIFLWVILWWRLWYTLFYNFYYYIENLGQIFRIWEWWMSFHGGVLWVLIAMALFSKRYKISFLMIADEVTAILPIWLGLGRIWNYLNKELLGFHPYTWPLATKINDISYFPSTLVESLLEGLVLFFILNWIYKNKKFNWQIWTLFLIFYSIFRILVEIFFRMPDEHIGYIFWFLTMWEILSLPMLVIWIYYYLKLRKTSQKLQL